MNPSKKVWLEKIINNNCKNIAGIVVQKDGNIRYEKYYNGYTKADTVHIASVTKSIVSALFGIAIAQGYIKSLDQKILDYFPDYTIKKGEKTIQEITIQNMMTMTVPYKCKTEPYEKVMSGEHWIKEALDLMGGSGKIGKFTYSPLIGTQVLSGIFTKATGQSLLEFARENLFSPLGIYVGNNVVLHGKEENLEYLKGKNISGWVVDPEGFHTAGWGLALTPLDMAKIGQLYLNLGVWEGKQIIPSDWINESTRVHCQWGNMSYGYLWWIMDEKEPTYAALGQGGNVIYVNTKKKMVVSIASLFLPKVMDRIKLIEEYVLPAFEEEE